MRIKALRLQPERKQPMHDCQSMELIAGEGINGDCHKGGDKQVSMLPAQAIAHMVQLGMQGLCMRRFVANIVVDGLRGCAVGDVLRIGKAELRITQAGKTCYPNDCNFAQSGQPCPLQQCLYAVVETGGHISVNDEVINIAE